MLKQQDTAGTKDRPQETVLKLVGFFLGSEEYAVDILKIKMIKLMQEITHVPKALDFVEGVINLRGDIVPIIDLRKKLKLGESNRSEESKIIVIEIDDKLVGVIVDEVSEVIEIEESKISPPPQIIGGVESEYLTGVGKIGDRLLILLDLDKILTFEEKATIL